MKTILLVDDESALVETLTELLENEAYPVVSAANGKDGLAPCDARTGEVRGLVASACLPRISAVRFDLPEAAALD